MGWFDPEWLKLHRRVCDQYEEIAFGDHAESPDAEINIQNVVARVLQKELRLTAPKASAITENLYGAFLDFSLRSAIEDSLRKREPNIPDKGVDEIFLAVKSKFLDTQHEHIYFIFFVISSLLCTGDYDISRGDYLMKICLYGIPKDKSLTRLWNLTKRFMSFQAADALYKQENTDS